MSAFQPASSHVIACSYGAAEGAATDTTSTSSYLDQGSALLEKYAPAIKTLLFDEDPRISYEKKKRELENYIASYKLSKPGITRNLIASKIRNLQAELPGIKAQIGELETAEATKQASKIAGIALIVGGVATVLLVGNYFFAKAGTERARRQQILAGRAEV